ncbi:MAG: formate dehydrogenase accessory sulfurtransferase FdhD [Steroidobacteraceae bacterium]|jgi:FdhD protein|nr:formate dehydrogenase accessory sulfurtransferase FdhD [Steroidobacteraceae bacterium]
MADPKSSIAASAPGAASMICEAHVQRWLRGQTKQEIDRLAEETPVALHYNGIPHVVMLASPDSLEDLAVGFTWSEALVQSPHEIHSVHVRSVEEAMEINIGVTAQRFSELLRLQRNMSGRTGCGVCGARTIAEAIRRPRPVAAAITLEAEELHDNLQALESHQPINAQTGGMHAAAWCLPGQGIRFVREDVGRHNALDKVIGALGRAGIDPGTGYFLITSRASYEMVQKAATVGVSLLAAVSAPTGLAVRLARDAGLTLVGFARAQQHVVYTHPQRLD